MSHTTLTYRIKNWWERQKYEFIFMLLIFGIVAGFVAAAMLTMGGE